MLATPAAMLATPAAMLTTPAAMLTTPAAILTTSLPFVLMPFGGLVSRLKIEPLVPFKAFVRRGGPDKAVATLATPYPFRSFSRNLALPLHLCPA
jgi:hypothetical protein